MYIYIYIYIYIENKFAIFQDLFTKWPVIYATPDQKAERIAKLLTQEIVPMFGVPEALFDAGCL